MSARGELTSLQRESVLTTAMGLAERDGVGALTMRRLAVELDVDPATLHRLYRDNDELLLALCDRTIALTLEAIGPIAPGTSWRAVLLTVADRMWEVTSRFPGISGMTFARSTGGPAERQIVELLLSTVSGTGLAPDETVLYYRAFADAGLSLCGQTAAANLGPTSAVSQRAIYDLVIGAIIISIEGRIKELTAREDPRRGRSGVRSSRGTTTGGASQAD